MNTKTKQYTLYRNLAFIIMIASQIVFGLLDVVFYAQKEFLFFSNIFSVLILLALILAWCSFDSVVRERRFRSNEAILIFMIGICGIPLYFWKTRTRREFFISIGGLFLYIIPLITYSLTYWATVKVMQFLGYYS